MTDELIALRREVERWRTAATEARALVEYASDAMFVADAQGRYVDVNESACTMLGYSRAELLTKSLWDLLPTEDARATPPRLEELATAKTLRTERRLRRKDGSLVSVELASRMLADGRFHCMARDITKREAAEKALHESEQTLRELGAALPALLWVRDVATGNLLYANAGWARLLDEPPVVGESFQQLGQIIHPEDRERVFAGAQQVLAGGEFDEIVRVVDREGRELLYRLFAFAIRDAGGRPYRIAGFGVNVTARLAAEEKVRASLHEKETLLKEIHHRVKNNLQIISSLLRLQAAKVEEPSLSALLTESQSRITSMALVHEMLYRSTDLSRIPFAGYVTALGTALVATYGASAELVVESGDLALSIDMAVPCGLLLNEILSNSFEHAFPHGERGAIRVTLELDGERYVLRASDDGVGLPPDFESRRRSALGTQLIENLVAQLGGTMERSSSEQGTRYRIVWPSG